MLFDGVNLAIGDSVYDVAYGSGQVIEVNEKNNIFRVAFGPRAFAYNKEGIGTFPRKTLFWRDPVGGFNPMKNDAKWEIFCNIRRATAQALGI